MFEYAPQGVCSRKINFDIIDGKLHNVHFTGGCPGNMIAISKLVEGKDAKEVATLLEGNQCGMRGNRCDDQLAKDIKSFL